MRFSDTSKTFKNERLITSVSLSAIILASSLGSVSAAEVKQDELYSMDDGKVITIFTVQRKLHTNGVILAPWEDCGSGYARNPIGAWFDRVYEYK